MKKIPLEPTIVGAYKFLFQNIVSIVGTIWLPMLVYAGVVAGFVYVIVPHEWLSGHFAPPVDLQDYLRTHLGVIGLAVPAIILTGLLVGAMIRVGILRHALGEKTSTTFIWFSLGASVWRMVAAILATAVLIWGFELAGIIAVGLASVVLDNVAHAPLVATALTKAVLILTFIVAFFYVSVRLFFFLPAVIVAERKIGFGRAWELGKGNVWRIVLVAIAVVLPIYFLALIATYATVLPVVFGAAVQLHPNATPQEVCNFLKQLLPLIPVVALVLVVAGLAITGTVFGAIGRAYKAVTAPEA